MIILEIRDDATLVPIVSDHEPDGGTWDGTALTDFEFDNAKPHEVEESLVFHRKVTTLCI